MAEKRIVKIYLFLFLLFIASILYGQEAIFLRVNDSGVRIRDNPGLNSNIIRILDKNELVEFIRSEDLLDNSEYKWVNVKTRNETGWVYGEYLSYITQNRFRLSNIEDSGLVINGQTILSGMYENNLLAILGKPTNIIFNEKRKQNIFYYGSSEDIRFDIFKYNGRINYIAIKSPLFELTSGIKVGMHIREVLSQRHAAFSSVNTYGYQLWNRLRNEQYDSGIFLETDSNGIIVEILIGLPAR